MPNIPAYLEQFTQANLEEIILRDRSLEIIKELAIDNLCLLEGIKNGIIDLGQPLSEKELRTLAGEVEEKVKDFLGVSEISPYQVSYNKFWNGFPDIIDIGVGVYAIAGGTLSAFSPNRMVPVLGCTAGVIAADLLTRGWFYLHRKKTGASYNYIEKKIYLNKETPQKSAASGLAHELTHHITRDKWGKLPKELCAFEEGLARGAEQFYMYSYCQKHQFDAGYLIDCLKILNEDLFVAYLWGCSQRGKKIEGFEVAFEKIEKMPPKRRTHCVGTAAFALLEQQYDLTLYRQIFNEELHL
ncbi:MAG: hypothetical protein AABW48_01660 [Nanoarchaeota archaeon]